MLPEAQHSENIGRSARFAGLNSTAIIAIRSVYPAIDEPTFHDFSLIMIMMCCLTCGICGHASRFAVQLYTKRLRRVEQSLPSNYAQILIATFHVMHFSLSASLPFAVIERLVKIWLFGSYSCKTFHGITIAAETVSAWLIVALLFEQLILITKRSPPERHERIRFMLTNFALITMVATIFLLSLRFVQVKEVILHEDRSELNRLTILRIRTFQCILGSSQIALHQPLTMPFKTSAIIFCFNFLVPFLIMLIFTQTIVRRVAKKCIGMRELHRQILRIQVILMVVHFCAYSPNWTTWTWKKIDPDFLLESWTTDFIRFMPYAASAVSWLPLTRLSNLFANFDRRHGCLEEEMLPQSSRLPSSGSRNAMIMQSSARSIV